MCLAKHGKGMLISITCSSSFSVIHVSVNIKNNADKDMALLFFFFFLKVRAPKAACPKDKLEFKFL